MGGIGPVPATAGECSESIAVRKPAPDHHEAAHAMTVGANASWAPTINAVSAPEAAPRISWIPAIRLQPATSATIAATSDAPASTRTDTPPNFRPPEIQCCIVGAS